MFVGPSCQYLSLGGLLPIFETCVGCTNDGGAAPKGGHNNYVTYQVLTNSAYQVKGYMVTFPTTSDKVSVYCTDWIKVTKSTIAWCYHTLPVITYTILSYQILSEKFYHNKPYHDKFYHIIYITHCTASIIGFRWAVTTMASSFRKSATIAIAPRAITLPMRQDIEATPLTDTGAP